METKYYTYTEPAEDGVTVLLKTVSNHEILKQFYPEWKSKMIKKHGEYVFNKLYSEQECIEDFITIHWAWPAEEEDADVCY